MALSVDEREEQQLMIDRVAEEYDAQIEFTLLADPDNAVINRYGVFNPDDSRRRAIPHPTTLVIDKQGVVRWKFIEVDYRIRPTNENILAALLELE
jgi:peroxiredoxin